MLVEATQGEGNRRRSRVLETDLRELELELAEDLIGVFAA